MLRFTWSEAKARQNASKHGVHFEEAATAFGDRLALDVEDRTHSTTEPRFVTLGQSAAGRLIVAVYAEPEPETIRLISARVATPRERQYETEG